MPLSDLYTFNVGDRVRNSRTGEDGRIVNLQTLADGAVLVTVAIIVAGVVSKNSTFITRQGQISGLEWQVRGSAAALGASRTAQITSAGQGPVSAKAQALAAADQPQQRSMVSVIKARKDALRGRMSRIFARSDDPEVISDAIFDHYQHVRRTYRQVFQRKHDYDDLLNFLSARSHKGDDGTWMGGYLAEVVYNKATPKASAAQMAGRIEAILAKVGIPTELARGNRQLIPEGVETAYDLLLHARERVKRLGYTEGRALWEEYASVLRKAVQLSPDYRRLAERSQILSTATETLREFHRDFQEQVGFTRFGVQGDRTTPEVSARTAHELDVRLFGLQDVRTRPLSPNEAAPTRRSGHVDLKHRGMDRFHPKRDELGPALQADVARQVDPVAGGVANQRRIGRVNAHADDIFFNKRGEFVGKVVRYNGLPYQIVAIDPVTNRATLRPLSSNVSLRATNVFERGQAAVDAVKQIGRGLESSPLQIDATAVLAGDAAHEASHTMAARQTLRIKGGLFGRTTETINVPMDLMREYMSGLDPKRKGGPTSDIRRIFQMVHGLETAPTTLTSEQRLETLQILKQLGFDDELDFSRRAKEYGGRFGRILRQRLESQGRGFSTTARGLEAGRSFDDLLGAAHLAIFEHLGIVQENRPIQEIETELLNIGVRRGPQLLRDNDLFAAAFTDLATTTAKGDVIDGFEVAARKGRSVFGPGAARFNRDQFVTTAELFHDIRRFSSRIQDLRWGRDQELISRYYQNVFGSFSTIKPERGADLIELIQGQAQLATELYDLMEAGEIGTPEGQRLLRRFTRRQGLHLLRSDRETDLAYDLYQELRNNPSFGIKNESTQAAARSFHARKEAAIEVVKERGLRQRLVTQDSFTKRVDRLVAELHAASPLTGPLTPQEIAERLEPSDLRRVLKRAFPLADKSADVHASVLQALNAGGDVDATRSFLSNIGYYFDAAKTTPTTDLLITAANERQVVQLYNTAFNLPAEQQGEALRALGIPRVLGTDDIARGVMLGPQGERFLVQAVGEQGLAAVHETNPDIVRFMGNAADAFEMTFEQVQEAIAARQFEVTKQTAEQFVERASGRATKSNFLLNYVGMPPEALPVFRTRSTQAPTLGFLGNDLVNAQSVIENTKAMFEGKRDLLFIDIETNIETNRITNFAGRRMRLVAGEWVQVGGQVNIATPELWDALDPGRVGVLHQRLAAGEELGAGIRTAIKNGRRSVVDQVVSNQTQLVEAAAAFIGANEDALIAGHNIGFDISKLVGATLPGSDAATILTRAAGTNVADTLLAAPATFPNQERFSLEALSRSVVGDLAKQAHLADPDVEANIALFREQWKNREGALAALSTAEQVKLGADEVVWNIRQGRAYQVAGVLNAEQASDAFRQMTGKDLEVGFGVALRPIDFRTGEAAGSLQMSFARTPHGWATAFEGSNLIMGKEAARAEMEATARDLAMRRVRRVVSDTEGFTTYLTDRERVRLASQLGDNFQTAQDALIDRAQNATSAWEKNLASRTHRYSMTWLNDTRLQRQLELEGQFFQSEMGAHQPVIDWLEQHLQSADQANLKSAREQVNRLWAEYMTDVSQLSPWEQVTNRAIPAHKRQLSLMLPEEILGKDPVALRIGSQNQVRQEMNRLTHRIAKAMDPSELDKLFLSASQEEINTFKTLLSEGDNILDNALGRTVEEHIWEKYLKPVMAEGGFIQLDKETGEQLRLKATSASEAVGEIFQRGQEVAERHVAQANNYLNARAFGDELAGVQAKYTSKDVLSAFSDAATPENLRVGIHSRAPTDWVGKTYQSLIEQAGKVGEEAQEEFLGKLRYVTKQLGAVDRETVEGLLAGANPNWANKVFAETGALREAAEEVFEAAAPSARQFKPGVLKAAGTEMAEAVTKNADNMKVAGLVGIGLIGALAAYSAFTRPQGPPQSHEQERRDTGIASTEGEVERRKEKIANQTPLTSKVKVSVFADDPTGLSPDEITQSVHHTLGQFFGQEIGRAASVNDTRSKIDRDYLERLAGQMLQR